MENQVKPTTTAGVKGELTYEDKSNSKDCRDCARIRRWTING